MKNNRSAPLADAGARRYRAAMRSVAPPARYLRAIVAAGALLPLGGCGLVVLDPSGDVARSQANLVIASTMLMLVIIVPVMALTVLFAWRYRQSNQAATYEPDWDHSTGLELLIWSAPLLIIIMLGALTWISTHLLDPYRPIERIAPGRALPAGAVPLEIDVVALDWKWLFIYPEQGIATVNLLALPVDRQVRFRITASSVMNSFYVPALAGQIYAMPGMETKLHAVINRPGRFEGFSANYSGAGFSDMHFATFGLDAAGFAAWAARARMGARALDLGEYRRLERPSERVAPIGYGAIDRGLFARIVNQCVRPGQVCEAMAMPGDMAHPGVIRQQAPVNDRPPTPGTPPGALLKPPAAKGSSPNLSVPHGSAPGNAAPGADANRNMTLLAPARLPGRAAAARA